MIDLLFILYTIGLCNNSSKIIFSTSLTEYLYLSTPIVYYCIIASHIISVQLYYSIICTVQLDPLIESHYSCQLSPNYQLSVLSLHLHWLSAVIWDNWFRQDATQCLLFTKSNKTQWATFSFYMMDIPLCVRKIKWSQTAVAPL